MHSDTEHHPERVAPHANDLALGCGREMPTSTRARPGRAACARTRRCTADPWRSLNRMSADAGDLGEEVPALALRPRGRNDTRPLRARWGRGRWTPSPPPATPRSARWAAVPPSAHRPACRSTAAPPPARTRRASTSCGCGSAVRAPRSVAVPADLVRVPCDVCGDFGPARRRQHRPRTHVTTPRKPDPQVLIIAPHHAFPSMH